MQAHHADHHHTDPAGASHGNLKSYVTGFILSIILTVIPFGIVMQHPGLSHGALLGIILGTAIVQVFVHLVCFLHMNTKSEQRWNTLAFAFTLLIAVILIGGSVWIMDNLSSAAMPTQEPMPD
jgi:cytochrome o ubiquinol oxidase subunit IV